MRLYYVGPICLMVRMTLLLLLVHPLPATAEIVKNGLLTEGIANMPTGWQHEAFFADSTAVSFKWSVDSLSIGELQVANLKPADSRWVQTITVSPSTWYRVSGWARTEGVGDAAMGAYLSVTENGYSTKDIRGTVGWQLLDFWMKTRPDQHTLRLECRLGGFASLNSGTAEFTAISIAEGGNPPESSDRVYGGTTLDLPHQRTIVFALVGAILAAGVLLLLWRFATSPTRRIPP
ncbi:MAG: hypothetical protein WCA22_07855 [Candidatus Binatus sp.]